MAFAAGVAAAVCAFIPGPGWIVAAIIAAAVIAGLIIAGGKCAAAAATRYWDSSTVSQRSKLNGAHLLTLSSQMICPAQGGIITAEPTFWSAWGTQTLTNLGHVSNFAFGFLVGKGCANMAIGAGSAAAGASTAGEAVTTFGKTFAKDFAMTAKDNFVQQFTGWNQGGLFCRFMKGFGLYGEVKAHYDIWTDDEKSTWEKVKESGISLILDVFAAKGATTVCFPAGTKVHTQWGLADIEKLEVGVPVLTYNEETGEQEYKKVKKVMRRMTRRMCALELSNGTTIEVTPEHRFSSNGEWTPIEELNVNDTLQLKDNSIVVIENKIIFPTFVEVYNLEIEDNENYYVTEEGVLVHNGCNDAANKTEDPPGTFRDSNGKLRNSDGTFANDPSAVKKTKTGEEYQRNMSERQKALLRDADDPHADLSDEAREFIKENNGKKVPENYEVSHEEPLYTRSTHEGKAEIDVAENMKTQPKDVHRARHKICGDQYHQFGPANKPKIIK